MTDETKESVEESSKELQKSASSENTEAKDDCKGPAAAPAVTATQTKSKSQLKKERKMQARKEYWKEVRARKRENYRASKRQKMEEARARGEDMSEFVNKRRKKNSFWKTVDANGVKPLATVVIDLGFGDKMTEKERKSAVNQLGYCYSANGNNYSSHADLTDKSSVASCDCSGKPEVEPHIPKACSKCLQGFFELVMTSFAEVIKDDALQMNGCMNWRHVTWEPRHYTEVFAEKQREGKLVYLTSEADEALLDIDPDTVYVIGGIVDHNRMKGLTHQDATARGIRTARLPLEETIDMASRKVLTINHCYEMMLAFANIMALQQRKKDLGEEPLTAKQCWARAATAVLPARKGAHSKEDEDDDDENENTKADAAATSSTGEGEGEAAKTDAATESAAAAAECKAANSEAPSATEEKKD